jgi:hypothetical protein
MSKDLTKNITALNDTAKEYLKTKVDLVKISLLAKSTKLTAALINIWLIATFAIWILTFAAAGFVVWYGEAYQNYSEGFLIAGAFLILVFILFIIFREKIVTNPVLRNYSNIIFEDDKEAEL